MNFADFLASLHKGSNDIYPFPRRKKVRNLIFSPKPTRPTQIYSSGIHSSIINLSAEKGSNSSQIGGIPPVDPNYTTLTLGARIRELRTKTGLNQANLARAAGIAVSVLARYEQGKILDLSPKILQKIASALSIEPLELLPAPDSASTREFLDYFCPGDTWGSRIRKLRLSQGIQQKDLANMLGLTKAAVCRYEKDHSKPNSQIISKIEEILKTKSLTPGEPCNPLK